MHTVTIKKIITDWDMRKVYDLQHHASVGRLDDSEVLLALNKSRTMARFIDNEEGVHTYYAPPRTRYDVNALHEIATAAIGITLSRTARGKVKLRRAA